jgi:DNA-binding CsgD family transcriptional regulator
VPARASWGNEEPEGARFCGSCGAAIAAAEAPAEEKPAPAELVTCGRCGNEEPADAQFCGACGAELAAGRDFGERNHAVLGLVRPHLEQFRRRAHTRRRRVDSASRLTQREREILAVVADGATNGEVAAMLGISPQTVRKHLENAYEKLGVHTRTGAVAALLGEREEST